VPGRSTYPYTVAYFSMEVGLDPAIPTYAGGLGVLAGDTLRSAADLDVPMVGVTLLHRKGYFHQHLDATGKQSEIPDVWTPEGVLESVPARVAVTIEGRQVQVRAWRYVIQGVSGHSVPVYFLDTALPENTPWDQSLTDHLYGGDTHYRLCQEVVLGFGGVAMLDAIGHSIGLSYHMNEGHSALLTLALLEQQTEDRGLHAATHADVEAVSRHCVFTTHTPVPAGHDQFPVALVQQVLGVERASALESIHCYMNGTLNMTFLALRFAHYINGVAMRHGEVSHGMFPQYPINAITNGVHAVTWTSEPFRNLYDRRIPEWRYDNNYLRYAVGVPPHEIQQAHLEAKRAFLEQVRKRTGVSLSEAVMTLGFARRATPYKRSDLLLSDPGRLRGITRRVGPMQIIYAGKAHPSDEAGKAIIRHIFEVGTALEDVVRVVYLENYDLGMAKHLCAGVDLWVNTPLRPLEASGTSGMKAALNGVPSLSVLDGWWIEGHVEGVTGWAIGDGQETSGDSPREIASLYDKLERVILPLFYGRPKAYDEVRRSTIALNGSFFNTQRMLSQYLRNAYFPTEERNKTI
jgi:glycogen phosphorylase